MGDFEVDGYTLTRDVSSPLSWEVFINRQIDVTADVIIANDFICDSDDDCNDSTDNTEDDGSRAGIDADPPETTGCCITDPEDTTGEWDVIIFYSPHGGCIELAPRGLENAKGLSDNSQDPVTVTVVSIDGIAGYAEDDDDNYCFPVGTTTVTYTFEDSSGNSNTESYDVIIFDGADPVVDCWKCQDGVATGEINVCEGTTTGWTLTTMTHAAFQASVGDDNAQSGVNPNLLPGGKYDRDVDAITGKELDQIQLDCDCTEIGYNDTPDQEVTNTWNSWGTPTAFDTTEGIIGVVPTAPTDYGSGTGEGTQIFHGYTVSDPIGNVGSCTLPVLYDITPPDCTDFSAQPAYIPADGPAPNNYNYSEVVTFSEPNAADPLLADGSAS